MVPVHNDIWLARPGQTLSEVAQITGIPVRELLRLNDIPDVEQLEVGQILVLPVSK